VNLSEPEVLSDCEDWKLTFQVDFDGIYPVGWYYCGFPYWAEPPAEIRDELERKAYDLFHERRSGSSHEDDHE
jgi:hypothetical protein